MNLFGLLLIVLLCFFLFRKKKKTSVSTHGNDRLENGQLPSDWYQCNKDFVKQTQEEYHHFVTAWVDSRSKSPKEQYAALKSLVLYVQDLRKLCASKGECFEYWLSEKFCVFDEDDYQGWLQELKHIEDNFDELDAEYKERIHIEQVIMPQLRKELPRIIKESPGILQTEVYKRYPADQKDYVSSALYYMAREGRISREKTGRTYSLYPKK